MLEVDQLSVDYRGISALDNVSFTVAPGELVGLIGPNGAGKSTLIKALLGLLPMQGQVALYGMPVRRQRHRIAYVPQRSQIDWDYPITAWNVVMMAQTARIGWFRRPDRQASRYVEEALQRVDLFDLRRRQIGQLSGGQQQRVFLARALAQQADLFLFDEPFTGIDKKTEAIMLGVFAELRAAGKTLLICSHEWGEALDRYDRLLLLNRTLLANDTPKAVMTLDNIQRAYGENLQLSNGHLETLFFC
ncbi:MAG: metal ABC transporter ATP-binding protein [Leptolyngbya sp. IPPAS B-1204]|nr:ABC transporter ATP-binding protein [Elainella sp. C42_A2020_010]